MIIKECKETKVCRVVPFTLKKALITPKTLTKMGVNMLML